MTAAQRQNFVSFITALRSGEFKQCTKSLKQGDCYCVMGVACELFRRASTSMNLAYPPDWVGDCFRTDRNVLSSSIPPMAVGYWLGIFGDQFIPRRLVPGEEEMPGDITPVGMNDGMQMTFPQIADVLEKWLATQTP